MRFIMTTLCPRNDNGHSMGKRDGKCTNCGEFIPAAPVYTIEQRLRYEQLRTEWLHEQRALEKAS